MSERIALLAEAGPAIGTGHVVETLNLAGACNRIGLEPLVVVNTDTPEPLIARITSEKCVVSDFSPGVLLGVGAELARRDVCLAVTNFRFLSNNQVAALADAGLRTVCVDQWGGKHLDCNAVINASLVDARHQYTSGHPDFELYAGPEYMILSPHYARSHEQSRGFNGPIRSITVSMGGVDRTEATLRIAHALLGSGRRDLDTHIVAGAGASWTYGLERLMEKNGLDRWTIHRNMNDLASLFAASDVAFTAGGNTLYELACVGTPALVLYEDEHEQEQGLAFEAEGFGTYVGAGIAVESKQIAVALDRLDRPSVRRAQSDAGRRLVDGLGTNRICEILARCLSANPRHPHAT